MFRFTESWLMVPQPLYNALLLGSGAVWPLCLILVIYSAAKKKSGRHICLWSAGFGAGVLIFALTLAQKIVGSQMTGG